MTELDTPARWQHRAACVGAPTSDFYANGGPALTRAKTICAACPVTAECVDAAIIEERGIAHDTFGYRGGMTARARLKLAQERDAVVHRRRLAAVCGTDGGYSAHLARDETPCRGCSAAHAEKERERRYVLKNTGAPRGPAPVEMNRIAMHRHLFDVDEEGAA